MDKRTKIEQQNRAKLKLLHYFVSPTRLSVHNIPVKCTDDELKKIFLSAFDETERKLVRIVECRIMRDLTRVNSEGIAKSKGFGFVEFKTFDHALKALKATNNNPNLFEDKKTRLIVQFSIEDMRALKKRERRVNKNKSDLNKKFKPKSKKKRDEDELNEDEKDKKKQKNLINVHLLHRKIKRKLEEDEEENKKNRPKKNEER